MKLVHMLLLGLKVVSSQEGEAAADTTEAAEPTGDIVGDDAVLDVEKKIVNFNYNEDGEFEKLEVVKVENGQKDITKDVVEEVEKPVAEETPAAKEAPAAEKPAEAPTAPTAPAATDA